MRYLAFLALALVPVLLPAQTAPPPREWVLGFAADATKYYGDFTDNRFSSGGALSLKRYLSPFGRDGAWYARVSAGAYDLAWRMNEEAAQVFDTALIHIGDRNRAFVVPLLAQGMLRLAVGPEAELFFGAGVELAYFTPQDPNGSSLPKPQEPYGKWAFGIPVSVEIDLMLSDHFAFNMHGTFHAMFTDYLDGYAAGAGSDHFLTAGFGISYSFPPPDTDRDFDGLSSRQEREIYRTNPDDADTDHDGSADGEEVRAGTSPLNPDTDGDGLKDGDEIHRWNSNPLNKDTDGDGLSDAEETLLGTNPAMLDTDADGLNDKIETARGTDPRNRDTDGDGLPDGLESVSSPLIRDTDGDGLSDAEESASGMRPYDEDFDGDGLYDAIELDIGTDPKKPDTDNDGLNDYAEYFGLMTDPRNPDSDGDGIPDGQDPTPVRNTVYNPARNVAWSFHDLFRREDAVDETSKAFITMLHLIRSAPKEMLFSVDISVYGQTLLEARSRKDKLQALLEKTTRNWDKPVLSLSPEVKSSGLGPQARLQYVWKLGMK